MSNEQDRTGGMWRPGGADPFAPPDETIDLSDATRRSPDAGADGAGYGDDATIFPSHSGVGANGSLFTPDAKVAAEAPPPAPPVGPPKGSPQMAPPPPADARPFASGPEPALFTAAQATMVKPPMAPPPPPPTGSPHTSSPPPPKPTAAAKAKSRLPLLLGVLGVVVVGAVLAFLLLGRDDGAEVSDQAVKSSVPATSAGASPGAPAAPDASTKPPSVDPAVPGGSTALAGEGTQQVSITLPNPRPTWAFLALTSTASGPFSVTTINADGTPGAVMVEANGAYIGNRMLLKGSDGTFPTKVEVAASGPWTLDVRNAETAIQAGVNAGTGSTVLMYRGNGGELAFRHNGPGSFIIRTFQNGQPTDVVSVVGDNEGTAQVPGGPYPIEIVTDGSWLATVAQ